MKPIENQLRPKGLGLGADRSAIKDLEPSRHRHPPKPGEERDKEEELVMGAGGCVRVESGAHKELYGKVRWTRAHISSGKPSEVLMSDPCAADRRSRPR